MRGAVAEGKHGGIGKRARYWGCLLFPRPMATGTLRAAPAPATRVVVRCAVHYAVLIGGAMLAWPWLPRTGGLPTLSIDAMFGTPSAGGAAPTVALDGLQLAAGVAVAMLASVLLALPVAWVYLLTRAKRGYQQSVVQLLVILPAVVAGIVLLVKYSLALAFSLAGIVAAVRFRNTLDDSKDAVYVFLATGIGLAAAVNLPVSAVLSIGFNVMVLALWYTDFGNAPVELDGRIADRRLRRARQMARTGTFVARIDDEVFREMTRDQLEGVAERAWRRAHDAPDGGGNTTREVRLRIRTHDADALRGALEPRLGDHSKSWRAGGTSTQDGADVIEYIVQLQKKARPDDLVALVRATAADVVLHVEVLQDHD